MRLVPRGTQKGKESDKNYLVCAPSGPRAEALSRWGCGAWRFVGLVDPILHYTGAQLGAAANGNSGERAAAADGRLSKSGNRPFVVDLRRGIR